MKKGTRIIIPALLACLLPPVLTGCGEDALRTDERVSVSFSMPLAQPAGGLATKMSEEIVQNDMTKTDFRGLQELYVLPFIIDKETTGGNAWREVVWPTDVYGDVRTMPLYSSLADYKDDNDKTIKGYLFDNIVINSKVNAVLLYGKATETTSGAMASGSVAFKQHHGSLLTNLMDVHTPGAISFDLEPFLAANEQKTSFSNWKAANIDLLNELADASVTVNNQTYSFKTPSSYDNAPLEAALNAFTSEGVVFPGSNAMIGLKLTALYKACKALSTTGDTEPVRKLAERICAIIDGKTDLLEVAGDGTVTRKLTASETFGLPDGVVTMRWGMKLSDGNLGFDSPDKSEGVNVAGADAFCYPPALWYYANGPLLCNSHDDAKDLFVANTRWSNILDSAKGWIRGVTNVTRVAAVRNPMQYAVALLKLNIARNDAASLEDRSGNLVSIDNSSFPLTGIILGGQRTQTFDFTATEDQDNEMRFTYDPEVNAADGSALAWISSAVESSPVYTLALATRPAEDINFALEFRNDSEAAFTGIRDCTILPGSKFYLIGTMSYSNLPPEEKARQASVFVKDHYTTLNVSFSKLAASYAILPDLTANDLQLGVSTKLTWDSLTPTSIGIK